MRPHRQPIAAALRPGRARCIYLIGGGGKSTLLRCLGEEYRAAGKPVIRTTTTKVRIGQFGEETVWLTGQEISRLQEEMAAGRIPLVAGGVREDLGKYTGISLSELDVLVREPGLAGTRFLVEADGARGRPLKVPYPHEPVVGPGGPVVLLIGAEILGAEVGPRDVYNFEGIRQILGGPDPIRLDTESMVRLITHPRGCFARVPARSPRRVLLNKAEDPESRRRALALRERLASIGIPTVSGSLHQGRLYGRVDDPADPAPAILVLAAGESTRMGTPKQTLSCGPENFLEATVARFRPWGRVTVVLGHRARAIRRDSQLGDARIVVHRGYREGMGSSLAAGMAPLLKGGDPGVLVTLCDMPHLAPGTLAELVRQAAGSQKILVPVYRGRRGHPVYFPRRFFPVLARLTGDEGARGVLSAHPGWVREVPVEDGAVVEDIDRPDTYEKIRKREGWS